MKKASMILPMALILCFMVECQQGRVVADETVGDIEADIDAIKKLSDVYGSVVSNGDVDSYIELFTEDAIVMPPNSKIVIGRENILNRAKSRFGTYKEIGLEEVTNPDEIKIYGDWAFDLGITTYKTRVDPTVKTNKYIRIWQKQPDDSWKLARVIWNSNDPPPTSEQKR